MMVWQGFSHMKDFLATNQGHQNKKKKKKNYIKLLSTAISKGVFVFFFFSLFVFAFIMIWQINWHILMFLIDHAC